MDQMRVATVPGSKSITNRALLLAALSDREYLLAGAQFSDDSRYFLDALKSLGFSVREDEAANTVRIAGAGGRVPKKNADIYVGSAGTAARFLTAMLAFSDGIYTIRASEQMARRPMKPLFDALTLLGAELVYLGEEGHLPVRVKGVFAGEKPVDGKPVNGKPVDGKPVDGKPVDGKPVDGKPVDGKPVDEKPVDGKPVNEKPVDEKPVDGKPVDGKSTDEKPVNGKSSNEISLDISESTQYLSALLMTASMLPGSLTVHITGEKKRGSYIEITRRMMEEFGIRTEFDGESYEVGTASKIMDHQKDDGASVDHQKDDGASVDHQKDDGASVDHQKGDGASMDHQKDDGVSVNHQKDGVTLYQIEPDVSAACYFYAAVMLTGGSVQVRNVHRNSMQGDVRFLTLLEQMGAAVEDLPDGIRVTAPATPDGACVMPDGIRVTAPATSDGTCVLADGDASKNISVTEAREIRLNSFPGTEVNMNDFSDQAITLAALAPFASSPTVISGIAHIRRQESDRLHGMAENLARMGIRAEETEDSIKIWPGQPKPCEIETYDDHRMAMGFALAGLRVPGITIKHPECCRKTFKEYFEEMERVFGLKFPAG